MRRCVAGVESGGAAVDPGAVCGATFQRKSAGEKAALVAAEGKGMAKKKKKHPKKKHPKKSAHKKPHHKKKKGHHGKKHVTRCAHCGHSASHGKAGCLHRSPSGIFCSCKHR
jgi:sRNA-binding protein